jgi:hypothetical protein
MHLGMPALRSQSAYTVKRLSEAHSPLMPFFSSTWIFLGSAGINAQNAKSENVTALHNASSDASVQQTALLDGDYL